MHIVYLAAGNSQRFQSQKLLYNYQGKALFQYGLDILIQFLDLHPECSLSVIYREDEMKILYPDIHFVYSKDSHLGMSYSIRKGLENIDASCVMFMVADQPYITLESIEGLYQCYLNHHCGIVSLASKQRVGNPVIFHQKYFDELFALKNDQGGRVVIAKHKDDYMNYYIENDQELFDIDRQQDI